MSGVTENSLAAASVEDLKNGFRWEAPTQSFVCLFCGERFQEGVIYPFENVLLAARSAAARHVEAAHGGAFSVILGLGWQHTGISEVQEAVLRHIYEGRSDREIAAALGGKSESTVRSHRFQLRKRKREAKLFLAMMELLEERDTQAQRFVDFHADIPAKDDRVIVTTDESECILRKHFSEEGGLRLLSFPGKQKAKLVVLNRLAELFERGRRYSEEEVNRTLRAVGDETGEIRRYLVDYGFLARKRDGSAYWRA